MTITRDWVMKHRTANGGWTRVQLGAIGVAWPPRRGWVDLVCGRTITPDQQKVFERVDGSQGSFLDHVLE